MLNQTTQQTSDKFQDQTNLDNTSNTPQESVTPLNKQINKYDPEILKQQIVTILGQQIDSYGVYVSQPDLNFELGINENSNIYPASISKLPIAILVLRDIDNGKVSLADTIILYEQDKAYDTDGLYYFPDGTPISIQEYLRRMIEESDNTAMTVLENYLGGYQVVNKRTLDELNTSNLSRYPMKSDAVSINNILNGIYSQKYLTKESNDLLIDNLTNIASWLQDRIPAAVPSNVKVAHKIGNLTDDYGVTYNDAGIIYGPKYAFILTIINQNVNQNEATNNIKSITSVCYNFFENQ